MRLDEAKAIYRAQYWNPLRCDALPAGLDYAVFDYGINSGIARAARVLRHIVDVAPSAVVDSACVAAVARRDPAVLVGVLCD
jgi:lysozyme family protein